jgi:hypothetical protein
MGDRKGPLILRPIFLVIIGILFQVLAVVGLVTLFINVRETNQETIRLRHETSELAKEAACQQSFNTSFINALKERQSATEKDREAQKALNAGTLGMLNVILDSKTTSEQRLQAIQDWRKSVASYDTNLGDAQQKRAENPLPSDITC